MKKIIIVLTTIFLTACTYPLTLFSADGENGKGEANSAGKKVTINLSGKTYVGTYVYDEGSVGIAFGSGTGFVGRTPIQLSSTTTSYATGSGNGRVLVRASDGTTIRCEFQFLSGSGLGVCQRSDGKIFDLQINN